MRNNRKVYTSKHSLYTYVYSLNILKIIDSLRAVSDIYSFLFTCFCSVVLYAFPCFCFASRGMPPRRSARSRPAVPSVHLPVPHRAIPPRRAARVAAVVPALPVTPSIRLVRKRTRMFIPILSTPALFGMCS